MSGERLQILRVGGQHRTSRFRERNDQRIDCGTASRQPPQQRRPPGNGLRNRIGDLANFEEPVLVRIPAGVSL